MGDFKDLTGQYFGKWEALSYEGEGNWKCKCHCEYCGGAIRNVHR